MPITDYLRYNATAYGDEVALVEINPDIQEPARVTWHDYELVQKTESQPFRREITWKVFDEKANRLANLLLSRGIGKGHKVAILMMNCLEWMPIYFGVLKSGAVAVPFNFRYTSKEIQYCVELSDADVLIFGREFIGRVEEIAPQISRDRILMYVGADCPSFAEDYREMAADCSSEDPHVPLSDDDEAAIYFSSGTTGFPKAILHNHMSILHAARSEQVHHSQTHDDVFLCIPPLYHTGAKIHLLGHLLVGSKSVLLRGVTPENIFKTVSEEGCTVVWLLVPWAQDILVALDEGRLKIEDYNLDQWRMMHIGAQPVPRSLVNNWLKYFPHHDYDTNYGLSEGMGPGSVHLGVGNIHKVGAIGIPGFGWEAKLIDGNGETLTEMESVGELCLKGPALMNCYYNNPEATAACFTEDGYFRTGDIGVIDDDRTLFLMGRCKNMLLSANGQNIYPEEIETLLNGLAYVAESVVVQRGSQLHAIIVPDMQKAETAGIDGGSFQSIMAANIEILNRRLPAYEAVNSFELRLEPFSKTPKGSIRRFLYS